MSSRLKHLGGGTYDGRSQIRQKSGGIPHEKIRW